MNEQKWLLAYDPEVKSHPFTLVKVEIVPPEAKWPYTAKGTLKVLEAVQVTKTTTAMDWLQNPQLIEQAKV